MLILGVGADNGVGYQYGLSDVIRIARVDFVNPKITMLSLPRDAWIELPGIVASNGMTITHAKLNQAYFYGGPGMGRYDGPGGGPGLLARTLDFNFGLRVDHYGAVNMSTFERIVDAVGGIDVYLERDVDGTPWDNRTADMGYFPAGNHHLSGSEALRLSRIRKRYGDFARQDNQTLVICALRAKLLTPAVLTKIPKLVTAFQDSVLTDLTPEQIGQLACLLPKVDRENVIFSSIPSEEFTLGRATGFLAEKETSVLRWEPDVIRDYVSRFVSGTWPTQPDEPSCP
jgi:LCP family protein required for cell wall assembly